jgi:hypothetical protein
MMRRRGGLVRGVARTAAVAGTASVVAGRVHHRQQERWADENQQETYEQQAAYNQGVADAQQPPPPPAPAPAPAPAPDADTDDLIAQLEKLGSLRDQGILTDAEFDAQKAKLLAG